MGVYDEEMALVAAGEAKRGWAALRFFEELDAETDPIAVSRRPDYSDTLFAPANDDIYRELCAFIDQDKPRHYDEVADPISVNGYTAADVYYAMKKSNWRLVDVDAGAVYDMLVTLRNEPEIAERILAFRPTCAKSGAC